MAFKRNDSKNVNHINCVGCKLRPFSLRNFLYPPLIAVYLGLNILSTLLSITLSLYSNLGVRNFLKKDAVSYQSSAKAYFLLQLLLIYHAIR
jgi:hypothetical protein